MTLRWFQLTFQTRSKFGINPSMMEARKQLKAKEAAQEAVTREFNEATFR